MVDVLVAKMARNQFVQAMPEGKMLGLKKKMFNLVKFMRYIENIPISRGTFHNIGFFSMDQMVKQWRIMD